MSFALESTDGAGSTWQTLFFVTGSYSKYSQTKLFRLRPDLTIASSHTLEVELGRDREIVAAADVEVLASSIPQTNYAQ